MITRKYKKDYKGPRRSMKDISNREDSPCYKCLVKSTCSRSVTNNQACNAFIDYVFEKLGEETCEK